MKFLPERTGTLIKHSSPFEFCVDAPVLGVVPIQCHFHHISEHPHLPVVTHMSSTPSTKTVLATLCRVSYFCTSLKSPWRGATPRFSLFQLNNPMFCCKIQKKMTNSNMIFHSVQSPKIAGFVLNQLPKRHHMPTNQLVWWVRIFQLMSSPSNLTSNLLSSLLLGCLVFSKNGPLPPPPLSQNMLQCISSSMQQLFVSLLFLLLPISCSFSFLLFTIHILTLLSFHGLHLCVSFSPQLTFLFIPL